MARSRGDEGPRTRSGPEGSSLKRSPPGATGSPGRSIRQRQRPGNRLRRGVHGHFGVRGRACAPPGIGTCADPSRRCMHRRGGGACAGTYPLTRLDSMPSGPSLYRRHRPRTFADVVGQEHVVRTLQNAVQQDKVHHAYLFVGSRGTGKTSMAKILAACLNCVNGPTIEPCGVCESCTSIASASSLDVIEMDAASNNSVDDIRDLREKRSE